MDIHRILPIEFDSVADLYDYYVRTDFDINFWVDESKSAPGKLLELACGTGRVSLPLLQAGLDLTCVDYSPGMLSLFRQKLQQHHLSCSVYCQDIAELNLADRFGMIFIPFHSFSEIVDRHRQRLALARIHLHLTTQGKFVCTLQNPPVRTSAMDGAMRSIGEFPMPAGGTLVVSSSLTYNPLTRIASGVQVYNHVSAGKTLIGRRSLVVNFCLHTKREFESLVSQSGFLIESLYGDYERNPFEETTSPFMIWILRKNPMGTGTVHQTSSGIRGE